jgi:hypothetical protein
VLNREFDRKEKIVMLLIAILLLGFFYFWMVKEPVAHRIAASDTTELENQIQVEQQKNSSIKQMEQEMNQNETASTAVVATYDNFKQESIELNRIFAEAVSYSFSFEKPVASGETVRRNIGISFTAADYTSARRMIDALHNDPYRCLIHDVSLAAIDHNSSDTDAVANLQNSQVSGSLTVTFYETLHDAATREGLEYDKSTDQNSKGPGLAGADFSNLQRSDLETAAESFAASH